MTVTGYQITIYHDDEQGKSNPSFPIAWRSESGMLMYLFSISEAREIIKTLTDTVESIEDENHVQITIGSNPYHWTYAAPRNSLAVGDIVQVPFGYEDTPIIGCVSALGKGNPPGGVKIKTVINKLSVEPLAA